MLRAAFSPGHQLLNLISQCTSSQCRTVLIQFRRIHTSNCLGYRYPASPLPLPPHLDTGITLQDTVERVESQQDQQGTLQELADIIVEGDSSTPSSTYLDPSTQTLFTSSDSPPRQDDSPKIFQHLDKIHTTKDVMEAWNSFEALSPYLSDASHFAGDEEVLYLCLHRLARLLSAFEPRTRTVKLRIISVVCTLQNVGARVHAWQRRLLKSFSEDNDIRSTDVKDPKTFLNLVYSNRHSNISTEETTSVLQEDVIQLMLISDPSAVVSATSDSQSFMFVPPVRFPFPVNSERARILNILGFTQSFVDAWEAYRTFLTLPLEPQREDVDLNKFPEKHLHRLVALLATVKPRTRKIYLCLVSILSTMRGLDYPIRLWEWNFLIDCSAKGWRKTRIEDYKTAVRVFNDMLNYQAEMQKKLKPLDYNTTSDTKQAASGRQRFPIDDHMPDIYTYTTLIAHAARTLYQPTFQHAKLLLDNTNLEPNRITLLSQMKFYTARNQIFGVRHIVAEMRERGFDFHNDGINALLWAFARNDSMETAEIIYRLLRNNVVPEEPDSGPDGIEATALYLDETENIVIPPKLLPDKISYTIMIQCHAYQGDLTRTLQIFMDMLSSPDPVAVWRGEDEGQVKFAPIMPIFRAIFLGFYRHTPDPRRPKTTTTRIRSFNQKHWNIHNLNAIYKSFLELPGDQKPEDRLFYWIIMAFAKASGYDTNKLRNVWKRLEKRFGNDWGQRLRKLRKSIYGNTEHTKTDRMDEGQEGDDDYSDEDK